MNKLQVSNLQDVLSRFFTAAIMIFIENVQRT